MKTKILVAASILAMFSTAAFLIYCTLNTNSYPENFLAFAFGSSLALVLSIFITDKLIWKNTEFYKIEEITRIHIGKETVFYSVEQMCVNLFTNKTIWNSKLFTENLSESYSLYNTLTAGDSKEPEVNTRVIISNLNPVKTQ